MIPFAEAVARVREAARVLPAERVALTEAAGRVLAEDVVSTVSVPRFASSAMDGFAIALESGGDTRAVRRKIVAGDEPLSTIEPGEAIAIMTGAPLPDGADAIVKIEDAAREGDRISIAAASSTFVRAAGTDFSPGMIVAAKGSALTPELLMAVAAIGVGRVSVVRRPRVLVIPTGRELRDPGEPLTGRGEIWCSSSVYLHAALSVRCDVTVAPIVRDDPSVFKATLSRAYDLIVTTGAVSMGEHDFIPGALREVGAEIVFHKMATRPAKPTLFARLGETAIFGLAGNPISTAVGCRFLVQAYVARCLGLPDEIPQRLPVVKPMSPPAGLTGLYKCQANQRAEIGKGQESHLIRPLTEANAWAVTTDDPLFVDVYGIGIPR